MISKRVLFIAAALVVFSSTFAMAQATANVDNFNVGTLTIGPTDTLNLQSTASWGIVTTTPFSTVQGYIANGQAGGAWNGVGGISSVPAATDPNGATTVALVSGDDYLNLIGAPTFHGHTVASTDSLMRYTYYGDSNLDGVVNSDDYGYIDFAYQSGGAAAGYTGWVWGDYTNDGQINSDDYGYIDYVYQSQFPPLGGSAAAAAGAVVPEPSTVILLVSSAICALFVSLRKR